jgi:hypothetical protein
MRHIRILELYRLWRDRKIGLPNNKTIYKSSLFFQFNSNDQEIIFPFPFIYPICEIPVERHTIARDLKGRKSVFYSLNHGKTNIASLRRIITYKGPEIIAGIQPE